VNAAFDELQRSIIDRERRQTQPGKATN